MSELSQANLTTILSAAIPYEQELEQKMASYLCAEDIARFRIFEEYHKNLASAIVKCTAGNLSFTPMEIIQIGDALDRAVDLAGKSFDSRMKYLSVRFVVNSLTPTKSDDC